MTRNKKWCLFIVVIVFIVALLNGGLRVLGRATENDNEVRLIIDCKNISGLPKNFRKANDNIAIHENKAPKLYGLASLNISGSAQFSEDGIKEIKKAIGEGRRIIDVDLRQECHGFINEMAVSFENKKNNANKGKSLTQVVEDENEKLQNIKVGEEITFSNCGNLTLRVKEAVNESSLVKGEGMGYIRIPVTDREIPTNEMVDYFINFIKNLPEGTWLHFHCKHGIGRTTTFMIMYDSMKNAKDVSFEDIVKRQGLLGGKSVLEDTNIVLGSSGKKYKFLEKFYQYCKVNKDGFNTDWQQWLKDNNITISYKENKVKILKNVKTA